LHDGEIADRLGVEVLLAHAAGDRDLPRSTERRATINCHAPLRGIDYLSIDRPAIRSLSNHVNLYLSIERATEVGSFCGWYVRGFSGLPKAGSPRRWRKKDRLRCRRLSRGPPCTGRPGLVSLPLVAATITALGLMLALWSLRLDQRLVPAVG
jgi:hypothetical protein